MVRREKVRLTEFPMTSMLKVRPTTSRIPLKLVIFCYCQPLGTHKYILGGMKLSHPLRPANKIRRQA